MTRDNSCKKDGTVRRGGWESKSAQNDSLFLFRMVIYFTITVYAEKYKKFLKIRNI